jgi:hypothetical protein
MRRKDVGLFHKFDVTRVDGESAPGKKHEGCDYFVLDITHDPFAIPALKAYAAACKDVYPVLAKDIKTEIKVKNAKLKAGRANVTMNPGKRYSL